jgi:Flp pilus assembly protein TadG
MKIKRIISDQNGGVLVEATVVMILTFLVIFGSVDFLNAFYQWNMANKAVQFGTRIAAVSDPVASDLPAFDWTSTGLNPGDPLPANSNLYSWTCTSAGCSGTSTGYSADALKTIVFGRNWLVTGNASCDPTSNLYLRGMCHMFPRVGLNNVQITYTDTGLGFAYRSAGPIPTVTVRLQNLPFQFFFLSGLMGFATIQIPAEATTITGEDLSLVGPSAP